MVSSSGTCSTNVGFPRGGVSQGLTFAPSEIPRHEEEPDDRLRQSWYRLFHVQQCTNPSPDGVADSLGPHVVPHPVQEPSEEDGIHQHRHKDEHDRYRHRPEWDDYGCCPHADLPPDYTGGVKAGKVSGAIEAGPSGA